MKRSGCDTIIKYIDIKKSLTPVFLSFIMTSSSQWPSKVTRTSLANRILPDIALVNSPPPKNGCKKYNHKKYQYHKTVQTLRYYRTLCESRHIIALLPTANSTRYLWSNLVCTMYYVLLHKHSTWCRKNRVLFAVGNRAYL